MEIPQIAGLQFERAIAWEQVFSDWCIRETGADWGWEKVWTQKGFSNWQDWRMGDVARFGLLDRSWNLYTVENPTEFIPRMYVGAYPGWRRYYPEGVKRAKFSELVGIEENQKVAQILEYFPPPTTMIAIKHGNDMVIFEGTHRAAALALMAKHGQPCTSKIQLAITELRPGENVLFEANTTQIT